MVLNTLAGNAALKRQLSAQAEGRGLSHAYLISGPKGSGKGTLARAMAAAMVCTGAGDRPCGTCPACKKAFGGIHPDITVLGADGKDITVGQARSVRADAYIRPNEAPRKVYIIENAQSMNPSAQNAMLKLLEEGPAYAAFLLLTENPGSMLPTIRSRCEGAALAPVSLREAEVWLGARFPELPPETVHAAAQQCGGLLGRAVDELEGKQEGPAAEGARALLECLVQGDELALAQWCVGLEKWDREGFSRLMEQSVALLQDALALQAGVRTQQQDALLARAATLPRKRLLACVERLESLRAAARFNVGVGHLCGALAAGLSQAGL